jgi:outer membrane protein W
MDSVGVRGGIGADITFDGVAFGAGVNKLFMDQLEVGLVFYYGSFQQTSNNGVNTYVDTTKITALAAFLNYLYGYNRNQGGFYFLAGAGLAYLGVNWEESSKTDPTLGTPLPGGGSKQTFAGSVGGALVSLGAGYAIAGGLDLRLEVPLIITFSQAGGASTLIPLFALTAGYRFGP